MATPHKVKQEIVPLASEGAGAGSKNDRDDFREVPKVQACETQPEAEDVVRRQDGPCVEEAEEASAGATGAKEEQQTVAMSEPGIADEVSADGRGVRKDGAGDVDHCAVEEAVDELVAAGAEGDRRRGSPARTVGGEEGSKHGGRGNPAGSGSDPGALGGLQAGGVNSHEQDDVSVDEDVAPVDPMRSSGGGSDAASDDVDVAEDPPPPPPRIASPRGGALSQHAAAAAATTPPRAGGLKGLVLPSKSASSPSSRGGDEQSEELVACQTPPRIEGRLSSHGADASLCESADSDGLGGGLGMSEAWNTRLQCSTSVDTLSKEGRLVDLQSPAVPAAAATPSPSRAGAGSRQSWDEIPINRLGAPLQVCGYKKRSRHATQIDAESQRL